MHKILTVIAHYLPGYKSGGATRTLVNMVENLGDEFLFYILTADRDSGDKQAYPNICPGHWQTVGKAQVLYMTPTPMSLTNWYFWLNRLDYDVVYLHSYFSRSTIEILLLRKLKLIPEKPVILAPRGEFSIGALDIKRYKKKSFIALAKKIGLYQNITWQVSSNYELQDLYREINSVAQQSKSSAWIAPDLLAQRSSRFIGTRPHKHSGSAHIIFLSRIVRKKNIDMALRLLKQVKGQIQFDIYGPIEDYVYWQECQTLINQLPASIKVTYKGPIAHENIIEVFSKYHLFLFPTRGENFGHVIVEAMSAGCPVLISDQTPWQNLTERKVGWSVPLKNSEDFQNALNDLISMDELSFMEWSTAAQDYATKQAKDIDILEMNKQLFMNTLSYNSFSTNWPK